MRRHIRHPFYRVCINKLMYFRTFDEALNCLAIANLKCLTIAHCKGSYESFTQNGRVLHCIGQGRKRSPGHPSGHQNLAKQILLTGNQRLYPVFHIYKTYVEYMGNYRLISYKRTMSFEGFLYFEYKFFRENVYQSIVPIYSIVKPMSRPLAEPLAEPVPVLEVKLAPIVSTGFRWFPSCSE